MKLRKSHYGLKFGGMMPFTMKWITVWNGHTQLMFTFSDLSLPKVLLFSERLVAKYFGTFLSHRHSLDALYSHWSQGDVAVTLKVWFSNSSYRIVAWMFIGKLLSGECCRTPLKVGLHGRRQGARLARDMLQCDLLRGNSVYMVGSCRTWLLHIIHVSALSEVSVLEENCSRQPVPLGNFKFKLKLRPGLAAVAHLLRAACHSVNVPVVFLCFYIAARLSFKHSFMRSQHWLR